ncbi:MAG TPA: hypothetical protein VFG89_10935 [Coriobacteriia bacterium]|nr:hypothetical protein [Coriobacteriia bacterium]
MTQSQLVILGVIVVVIIVVAVALQLVDHRINRADPADEDSIDG